MTALTEPDAAPGGAGNGPFASVRSAWSAAAEMTGSVRLPAATIPDRQDRGQGRPEMKNTAPELLPQPRFEAATDGCAKASTTAPGRYGSFSVEFVQRAPAGGETPATNLRMRACLMLFHSRATIPAPDRALIDAHIAAHVVTVCPPCTYSEPMDVIIPMREQIRRAAVAGKAEAGVKDTPKAKTKRNRLAGQNARRASSKAERLEAVAAMIREGADLDKIATKFGVSFKTVQKDRTTLAREGRL